MKKIILAALLLVATISYSFADGKDGINNNVKSSFSKDFANAKEVRWQAGRTYIKATFRLNEQVMFAFYSADGNLVAVTRNLLSSQLPIAQLMILKKRYANYWITDLFEISSQDENGYYVTLENANAVLVLKSSGSDGWIVYSKRSKSL